MNPRPDYLAALSDLTAKKLKPASEQPAPVRVGSAGSPNIRLSEDDGTRLNEIIMHAATAVGKRISVADAFRLALHGWNYNAMSAADLDRIRQHDRRRNRGSKAPKAEGRQL